jgi:hypothetical protein
MFQKMFPLIAGMMLILTSCNDKPSEPVRETISLEGTWRFAMDTSGRGIDKQWFAVTLNDSVLLPGTMDENKKGIVNTNTGETMRLSRELMYSGMAWYQKEINIPDKWNDKNIRLIMERTKPTKVWVDSAPAGENRDILTQQVYELSGFLTPGKHTLTILVNNGNGSVPGGITGSHAWTEHTQTNWNGIIGRFCLEACNKSYIKEIKTFPDPKAKKVLVKLVVFSPEETGETSFIVMKAGSWNTEKPIAAEKQSFSMTLKRGENKIELDYDLGNKIQLWSEFEPVLYKLEVTLKGDSTLDAVTTDFGMRRFSASGTQFTINGLKTFLRGKHDACVFPLTGHPPMDVESWRKVFRIAKSYNINFYRFHSWTPPEAAFLAADIEGIYMQPELSFWGSFSRDRNLDLNAYLLKQGENILEKYGNHASFVMFALGNELSGDQNVMNDFLKHFRSVDNRPLMAYGSNNYLGYRGQAPGEDYFAGCRIGPDTDDSYKTHIRASFSFADANDGGYLNGRYPSTNLNYSGAIANCTVPALGTEVGQYQIYPDYNEIKKYSGVLKPWNLEIFRKRLEENNLTGQAPDFFRASGASSVICYRADIEMALRTPGFGGFHLLDLQDFPGQGTALIGILDAFMDSKGLITPEEFSHFCNRVVPLLIIEKYCWTNNETLKADIQVANYSNWNMVDQDVLWEIKNSKGEKIAEGEKTIDIAQGGLSDIISLNSGLSVITKAEKVTLSIKLSGTPYENSYSLWIYPADADTKVPADIIVSNKLDKQLLVDLSSGAKVLFFPDHKAVWDQSVGGLYIPDYWNYRMFKSISENNKKPVSPGTMSILTNPGLPLFSDFPTEFHTNWQWWPIVKNSRPFILDNAPKDYFPLVQVVDNIERNHKLGLIFEFAAGKGKLLVCMSDLRSVQEKPEARQLYSSILKYMSSGNFNPSKNLSASELNSLFSSTVQSKKITGVVNLSY